MGFWHVQYKDVNHHVINPGSKHVLKYFKRIEKERAVFNN